MQQPKGSRAEVGAECQTMAVRKTDGLASNGVER